MLCSFSLLRIFLFMTGAMLLGVGLAFLCQGMAGPQLSVALVALPLLAMAYLRRAYEDIPLVERPRRTVPRFSYPWKLFALYALYAFAYGLRANLLVEGAGTHSSISTALVTGVLFLSAYYFAGRFNIGALYRSPVLLMVCGFLLIPMEGLFGAAASSYLIAVSYSLMGLLVMFLLYDISKRMGVAIVAFMACKNAEQFFVQAGSAATDALGMSGLPADTQSLVVAILVCVLILGATLVLFSERELSSKWGVDILATGGLVERSEEEERREERCRELVETYRLSPREEEVLLLLAEGKTGRVIQQELFIAEGTFKAHTRHIYEKMSIKHPQGAVRPAGLVRRPHIWARAGKSAAAEPLALPACPLPPTRPCAPPRTCSIPSLLRFQPAPVCPFACPASPLRSRSHSRTCSFAHL